MVRAWYMDKSKDDQRLEHHREPPEFVSLDVLYDKTGVEYFKVLSKCDISIKIFRQSL